MILAIDTTLSSGSIALATGNRVFYSVFFDVKITHSETLMPAIDHALKFCNSKPTDLKAVYVCKGPGSFTGLRIGLATAKGIAFGLNIPLYTFSSLELTALGASGLGKNILVAIDAKMKEIYYAVYDAALQELIPPQVSSPADMTLPEADDFILCGSATELVKPVLTAANRHFHTLNPLLSIPNAAGLFYLSTLLPEKHIPQDLALLEPLYLRDASAQVRKG